MQVGVAKGHSALARCYGGAHLTFLCVSSACNFLFLSFFFFFLFLPGHRCTYALLVFLCSPQGIRETEAKTARFRTSLPNHRHEKHQGLFNACSLLNTCCSLPIFHCLLLHLMPRHSPRNPLQSSPVKILSSLTFVESLITCT